MAVDPLALRMWFESVDTDRSGRISSLELRSALAMGALHYSTEDCEAMIKAFGNGQRGLDLDGFSRLHTFLGGVRQSFEYFDQDRSGTLQPHELKMAMAQAGYNVPAEVVAAVCKRYDLEARGGLTIAQYVRSCLFLHSVHQIFYSFDAQRTGSCTFKIDSFLYACAHIV